MTAPSVADVMRSVSSRAPSMRCAGASDEMIQLSTTEPMLEPMKPPMVAALTPRIAPPMLPPMAAPAAPRMRVAMGPRGAWVKRRRRRRPVRVVLRPTEGVQTRATPSPPGVPATRVMRWLWAATARPPGRCPRSAFDAGGRVGRCGDLRRKREPDCRSFRLRTFGRRFVPPSVLRCVSPVRAQTFKCCAQYRRPLRGSRLTSLTGPPTAKTSPSHQPRLATRLRSHIIAGSPSERRCQIIE